MPEPDLEQIASQMRENLRYLFRASREIRRRLRRIESERHALDRLHEELAGRREQLPRDRADLPEELDARNRQLREQMEILDREQESLDRLRRQARDEAEALAGHQRHIRKQQEETRAVRASIERARRRLTVQRRRIEEARAELDERDRAAAEREAELEERVGRIEQRERRITDRQRDLDAKEQTLIHREEEVEARQRDGREVPLRLPHMPSPAADSPPPTPQPKAAPSFGARLIMHADHNAGREVVLTESATVFGRDARCGIHLPLSSVSREHCRIERRSDGLWLVDLGSRNGTLHNGHPIDKVHLEDGDTINVGGAKFTVSLARREMVDLDFG